jgi:hypothetical protein
MVLVGVGVGVDRQHGRHLSLRVMSVAGKRRWSATGCHGAGRGVASTPRRAWPKRVTADAYQSLGLDCCLVDVLPDGRLQVWDDLFVSLKGLRISLLCYF